MVLPILHRARSGCTGAGPGGLSAELVIQRHLIVPGSHDLFHP